MGGVVEDVVDKLPMATIMTNINKVFTAGIDMAVTVGNTVVNNPLLLFGVVVGFVGLGVGLFKRLLHV